MKVYTKTGDAGASQLPTGLRASKGDIRFEALGQLDELNSLLGWCRSAPGLAATIQEDLLWVQDRIMTLCAQLAALTGGDGNTSSPAIGKEDVSRLEAGIDRVYEQMPMPTSFVIPGGSEGSCRLHLARTACRRAERCVTRCLEQVEPAQPIVRAFVNRLSDALFVWALYANHLAGIPCPPWRPRSQGESPASGPDLNH
jgi:cob(I)alamin adenosyltransferase